MIKIKDYVRVGSLEEAYELNQKRSACILGGMLWTKMGQRQVQTAIDLSGLGLDQIEESEEEFSIGCMVTLRQMEEHDGLNAYTDGAARESVRSIVGVQFRNLATVGGSIFGRFGFSDVLTLFLALDTEVELVHAGRMPLAEFACSKRDRDVLVRLIVKKHEGVTVYQSHRNSRTDFPVLTCAVRVEDGKGCAVLGARPAKAARVELPAELAEKLGATAVVTTATDVRGKFSVDAWAARHGCVISDMGLAKAVSAAILEEDIPLCSQFSLPAPLPEGTFAGESGPLGIFIGWRARTPLPAPCG